ncbi:MAG: rod shape-determining protein MreC [Aquificae bacterium]|nr:rod shape-determining protein MreC [Aquificota bacterium]
MKRKKQLFFFLIVFSLIAVFLFIPKVKTYVYDAFNPFLTGLEILSQKIETTFLLFEEKEKLIEENKKLTEKLEILKAEIVSLKFLELENHRLREIAKFSKFFEGYDYVSAKIIGYSPDNWSSIVFINAGEKNGIKVGDIVVFNGLLFGMISETGRFISKVLLISDRNFKITARTRKTREIVFYQGYSPKKGILKLANPEQDIRVGDIVETASIDGSYPEGIPIGKISSVEYEEGEFFKRVYVSININPYSTEYVVVIKRKQLGEENI